jgi:hypothetical protein
MSICAFCKCNTVTVALLPCKHTTACRPCALMVDKCVKCRKVVRNMEELKPPEWMQKLVTRLVTVAFNNPLSRGDMSEAAYYLSESAMTSSALTDLVTALKRAGF